MKSLSRVRLFAAPRTIARQAPPSVGFSRQEYWSGLPFPSPGDLPDPGIESRSPASQIGSLPSKPPGKPWNGKRTSQTLLTFQHPHTLPSHLLSQINAAWFYCVNSSHFPHCCSHTNSPISPVPWMIHGRLLFWKETLSTSLLPQLLPYFFMTLHSKTTFNKLYIFSVSDSHASVLYETYFNQGFVPTTSPIALLKITIHLHFTKIRDQFSFLILLDFQQDLT